MNCELSALNYAPTPAIDNPVSTATPSKGVAKNAAVFNEITNSLSIAERPIIHNSFVVYIFKNQLKFTLISL